MSLIHWWPLNGDCHDQGTKSLKVITSNINYSFGKMGKSADFTNDNSHIKVTDLTNLAKLSKYSMCCWVRLTSAATNHSSSLLSSGDWNTGAHQVCFALYNFSNNTYKNLLFPNKEGWSKSIPLKTPILLNRWYHITITYDGIKTKAYVNGVLQGESNLGGISITNVGYYYLGAATYYSGFTMHGQLNDFRIYDHTLSLKEIHEVSKGLFAHYTFQDPLLESTTNFVTNANFSKNWSSYGDGFDNMGFITDKGTPGFRVNNRKTWCGANTGVVIPEPGTYTFSVWCKPISRTSSAVVQSIYFSGCGLLDQATYVSWDKIGEWQRISLTRKLTSAGNVTLYLICYGGDKNTDRITAEYTMPQIEKNDHMTEFTYSSRIGECCDSSGFGNNASYLHNALLGVAPGDNITSFHCIGNNYITTPKYLKVETEFTMNIWGYMDNWANYTRIISCTEGGGWNIEAYPNNNLSFAGYDKNNGYVNAFTNEPVSNLKTGWHMFTLKFDTNNLKGYVDGVLKATSADYKSKRLGYNANNTIFIGAEAEGNDRTTGATKFNGYIKDFRMYATALSDSDILKLYNTPKVIDNHNNFYAKMFDENAEYQNSSISKKGIQKASELNENGQWTPIMYHNNKGGTNLFNSADKFDTELVYHNNECWSNFPVIKNYGKVNNKWHFKLLEQKDNGQWIEYEWRQNIDPYTATFANTGHSTIECIKNIPSTYGGMYRRHSLSYFVINNSNDGNWFGALGCWSTYQTGIPSIGGSTAGTKILWIETDKSILTTKEYKNGLIYSNSFNEIF